MAKATFGAGCFWHVEEEFARLPVKTEVGFMGGSAKRPSYRLVCGGDTGHAEVVQITYNPKKVKYGQLLEVFWRVHDPTQLNRQGPDVGYQYRSIIFYHTASQKREAQSSLRKEEKRLGKKIATRIEKASHFWRAEEYHQKYYQKHPIQRAMARLVG